MEVTELQYLVEPIGAAFSQKDLGKLSEHLTQRAADGYKFHSVFHVEQKGCMGSSQRTTYLAIFVRDE